MKKQILKTVFLATFIAFSSCNKTNEEQVELNNLNTLSGRMISFTVRDYDNPDLSTNYKYFSGGTSITAKNLANFTDVKINNTVDKVFLENVSGSTKNIIVSYYDGFNLTSHLSSGQYKLKSKELVSIDLVHGNRMSSFKVEIVE